MADRYWVGNGGNWSDDDNHWATSSGGSPGNGNKPTSSDNVYFDANSFSSGSQTVTIDETAECADMDWTGVTNTPDLAGSSQVEAHGTVTFVSGMTCSLTGIFNLQSSGSENINFAGVTELSTVHFENGGDFTLTGELKIDYDETLVAQGAATLDTNDQTITCGGLLCSHSSSSIDLSSSEITLTGLSANTSVVFGGTTPDNIDATTATIIYDPANTVVCDNNPGMDCRYHKFECAEGTINELQIKNSGTTNARRYLEIYADETDSTGSKSATINTLTFEDDVYKIIFSAGDTFTIGSITMSGTSDYSIPIESTTAGTQFTLSDASGTNTCDYLDIKDCVVTGGATWVAGANSTNSGNNLGWQWFTNASNAYASDDSYATFTNSDGDLSVSVSQDNGENWEDTITRTVGSNEETHFFGGASEKWGTTWAFSNMADGSFAIKIWGDDADFYQVYKGFSFEDEDLSSGKTLNGVEILVEAKYTGGTMYIDHVKARIHWGNTPSVVDVGTIAYAQNGRKSGEGVGEGTGILVFRDKERKWIASDSGSEVEA